MSKVVLILEDVRSLWNVGAILRTADAFGVAKIYLCGITGRPPRREISKVALGAEGWVDWEYRPAAWEVMAELRNQGYQIVALEKTNSSIPIASFEPQVSLALVVGNEVRGVSRTVLDATDAVIHIPMQGRKESLNVAVAAGIAIFSLLRK